MLIYAQLEDAAIARLKAASEGGTLGYRLAEIESYGGQFDDETFFTQIRKFPAVWVTVGGDTPKRTGARKWQCMLTLAVMVGTRNVRGERSTRHGDVNEPGSYQLAQDVRDLLTLQALALPVEPLALGPLRTLYNTRLGNQARSVLAVEFKTLYTYTAQDDTDQGDLTGIGLRYYLKPGDDIEDATDSLTLAA